jgi:uncharacterized integral membrane protein
MVSAWWLIVAVFGGVTAGVLIMALLQMAGDLSEQGQELQQLPR